MYITSRNGKRSKSVSQRTIQRNIDYILAHPGLTAIEYAELTATDVTTVNLIIERFLLDMVKSYQIAISRRGVKPDYIYLVDDLSKVPVRVPAKPVISATLPGVTTQHIREDSLGLLRTYQEASLQRRSPAKRAKAQDEFTRRVQHGALNHQDTINEMTMVRHEMAGMREAIQVLATAVTTAKLKEAA